MQELIDSLNPCCSGSGNRRVIKKLKKWEWKVLILVIAEVVIGDSYRKHLRKYVYGLNPCCSGSGNRRIILSSFGDGSN